MRVMKAECQEIRRNQEKLYQRRRERKKETERTKNSYSWALSYSAATRIGPRVEHQQLQSPPKVAITLQPANRNAQNRDE
jgi:hypothetical protein